jgi:hypothetical protein
MEMQDDNQGTKGSAIQHNFFQEVPRYVAVIEAAVRYPDMRVFARNLRAANTLPEMEQVVREATGASELMEFTRMDLGEVLRKRVGTEASRSLRSMVGNPVIMSSMAEHVPDAGSCAPVTILID